MIVTSTAKSTASGAQKRKRDSTPDDREELRGVIYELLQCLRENAPNAVLPFAAVKFKSNAASFRNEHVDFPFRMRQMHVPDNMHTTEHPVKFATRRESAVWPHAMESCFTKKKVGVPMVATTEIRRPQTLVFELYNRDDPTMGAGACMKALSEEHYRRSGVPRVLKFELLLVYASDGAEVTLESLDSTKTSGIRATTTPSIVGRETRLEQGIWTAASKGFKLNVTSAQTNPTNRAFRYVLRCTDRFGGADLLTVETVKFANKSKITAVAPCDETTDDA